MTFIHPLASALAQSGHVQEQLSADKTRQVRRAQTQARNVAALTDRLEHEVENVEAPPTVQDQERKRRLPDNRRRSPRSTNPATDGAGEHPHIDVTG